MILTLIVQGGSEIRVAPHLDLKQAGISPPLGDAMASPSLLPSPTAPGGRGGLGEGRGPGRCGPGSAAWQHSPLAAGAENKPSDMK